MLLKKIWNNLSEKSIEKDSARILKPFRMISKNWIKMSSIKWWKMSFRNKSKLIDNELIQFLTRKNKNRENRLLN